MSRIFSPRSSVCLWLILPVLLAGCAGREIFFQAPPATELTSVPFYPQTQYQCGPAALATVLGWSGASVDMPTLVSRIYLPQRQGSLQPEMIAAARRAGRIPHVIHAGPAALAAELAAGHPVLVLQNLGLESAPRWHYAVVVGYSPRDNEFILRSGVEASRRESVQRFMSSWQRGHYWGMVVLPPGQIPASQPLAAPVARAVADAEAFLTVDSAIAAWQALLLRWPDAADVLFGAANAQRRGGEYDSAEDLYVRLLRRDPDHAAGRNNFADLLLQNGCPERASALVSNIRVGNLAPPLATAVSETQEDIETRLRRRREKDAAHCRRAL